MTSWVVRSARETRADRRHLQTFSCADPAVRWQAEIEAFIRNTVHDWAFDLFARLHDPRWRLLTAHRE